MALDRKALKDLTARMKQLGLPDPAAAAREELESGEPILATYSFLTWLTGEMVPLGDSKWISRSLKHADVNPLLSATLKRLLAAGVDRDDLTTLVRIMQYRICNHVCTMLDQVGLPGTVPIQDFAVYHVGGGDSPEDDRPIARLQDLHEEIEQWDPSGESEDEDEE